MFSAIQKYFLSSSFEYNDTSALQDFHTDGYSSHFSIPFECREDANALMFDILTTQHEKTVHAILRIEGTVLIVSMSHTTDCDPKIIINMIDEIDRKAKKIKICQS